MIDTGLRSWGRTVPVSVTVNGADFTCNKILFQYRQTFDALDIILKSGPMKGGTEVSIHGIGFDALIPLRCRFRISHHLNRDVPTYREHEENDELFSSLRSIDSLFTNTQYMSTTLVKCTSPALLDIIYIADSVMLLFRLIFIVRF